MRVVIIAGGRRMTTDIRQNQPVYGARIERKFGVSESATQTVLDELKAHLPRDPMYPHAQPVSTTYIRSIGEDGPKGKIRVRSYPSSDPAPTFLEFKDSTGALKEKARISVHPKFIDNLLAGTDAADAVDLIGRSAEDQPTAKRAVDLIHSGMEPAVTVNYQREAFEDAAGTLRVTFDRNLEHFGVGKLAGASGTRPGAILEIKSVGGAAPAWLDDLLGKLSTVDGGVAELAGGKGGTAFKDVLKGIALLR